MSVETRAALDAIGNFRECLNDPHDFDQTMARLRAAVAEQAAESERLRQMVAVSAGLHRSAETDLVEARAALTEVVSLADRWDVHSRLFVAPVDLPVRQDWEHVVRSLRSALAPVSGATKRATP